MRLTPLIAVFGLALIQAGCADSRTPTDARASSGVANADRTTNGQSGKVVGIFDACDPTTFGQNNVSCTRSGGVTFDQFIAQVTQNQKAGGWHFAPAELTVKVGEGFFALNRGGETHTFTEVSQFGGGGIVPFLNEILFGTPNPPLFFDPNDVTFIPAGGEETITPTPGKHLYICAIHPWMEDTVVVR